MAATLAKLGMAALWVAVLVAHAQAQPRPEVGPRDVFAEIQESWQLADAHGITRHLGTGKVSIGLPEVEPVAGHFSRSQSYFILKALFEATQVQEFQFEHVRAPVPEAALALGLARRRYRRRGDGRVIHDRVLVALQREAGRWVITEIRALR